MDGTVTSGLRAKPRQLSSWEDLEQSRPLPLYFEVYASARTNRALCPCLVVRHRNINVIRILDPEHQQPYISLDSIFLLSGRTVIQGLLECDLHREANDYDLTLAGLEPREAIWAPLKVARQVVDKINLLVPLGSLLDWDTRHAWSLDEGEEGLTHNWRATELDLAAYSTSMLMQQSHKSITLLPKGQQVRTLLSNEQRQEATRVAQPTIVRDTSAKVDGSRYKFEQRLVRWSVLASEELYSSQRALESAASDAGGQDNGDLDNMSRFELRSNDFLLLFQDYITALQAGSPLNMVSLNAEEVWLRRMSSEQRKLSCEDAYREARINITLIHHFWTLYMAHTPDPAPMQNNSAQLEPSNERVNGPSDPNARLSRLEQASQRTEWALSELLHRKPQAPAIPPNHHDSGLVYLAGLDIRILPILLLGILLGSAASRL